MSNPTSNFNWQMPTNTDLVSQLPADFEVFGQAVDTSLADLKGGTTGQVLKKNSNTDMDFIWSADAAGMTNPMTTTGDTIYSSSGSTPARLGIGTAGQVLQVNSGATAPEWATFATGGMTQLATGTLSGTSTTISSISGSYRNLQLVIQNSLPSSQAGMALRFNADTTTNYLTTSTSVTNTTVNSTYMTVAQDQHTSGANLIVVDISDYANATTRKSLRSLAITANNGTPGLNLFGYIGSWSGTSAISSISMGFGGFATSATAGTYYLYGVK
jgi:hypothetical protein